MCFLDDVKSSYCAKSGSSDEDSEEEAEEVEIEETEIKVLIENINNLPPGISFKRKTSLSSMQSSIFLLYHNIICI